MSRPTHSTRRAGHAAALCWDTFCAVPEQFSARQATCHAPTAVPGNALDCRTAHNMSHAMHNSSRYRRVYVVHSKFAVRACWSGYVLLFFVPHVSVGGLSEVLPQLLVALVAEAVVLGQLLRVRLRPLANLRQRFGKPRCVYVEEGTTTTTTPPSC